MAIECLMPRGLGRNSSHIICMPSRPDSFTSNRNLNF
jgi:hypothetical protein